MNGVSPTEADSSARAGHAGQPPLVSVIMIFMNARDFIAQAIESVCGQTRPDWELVLVDDGSSDGSRQIAAAHAGRDPARIRLYEHPDRANRGTGPSRNLGMQMARGTYLCFLDADDVYEPQRLERPLALMEADPTLGVVLTHELYWRSWSQNVHGRARLSRLPDEVVGSCATPGVAIPPPVLIASTIATRGAAMPGICSITFRKEHVAGPQAIPGEFVSQYEDQALIVKLLLEQTAVVLPDCLARYRQHPQSLTHKAMDRGDYRPGRPHQARREFLTWLRGYLAANGFVEPVLNDAIARELEQFDGRLGESLRETLRSRLRGGVLAAINFLLPAPAANALIGAHLERKRANVRRVAALHAARVRPWSPDRVAERSATAGNGE
jgi:glycosyltransferase involved in cell wall biosynthesis